MPAKTVETLHLRAELKNVFANFLIWLALVKLIINEGEPNKEKAEKTAYERSLAYLQKGGKVIFSVAPHWGHTDHLFVLRAIKKLYGEKIADIAFVGAEGTWDAPLYKLLASIVTDKLILFKRGAKNKEEAQEDIAYFKEAEEFNDLSLVIFSDGTRAEGAAVGAFPASLADSRRIPIVVFNIRGARNVLPKVAKGKEIPVYLGRIGRRIARSLLGRGQEIPVTVEVVDFIDPNEGKLNRGQIRRRLLLAHRAVAKKPTTTMDEPSASAENDPT